jgi:hypothetical protein
MDVTAGQIEGWANQDDDSGGGSPASSAAPPSAIQGSISGGDTTDVSDPSLPSVASLSQKPSLARKLITSLGSVLLQGVSAGMQAPRNAQGPAVAAQIAANQPQKAFEQKMANQKAITSQQMDDLNVAMTQVKLHQMQMIASKMQENQQNAVYDKGRDTLQGLLDKGQVEVLATGDYGAVTQEFNRRQNDAKQNGQGIQPLQILPAVGSNASKPQYSLVMVGKGKLTEDWDETWGADDLGYTADDFKAAGLSTFKFKAPAGMDQQKALQLRSSQFLNWATKSENAMAAWKKNQANIDARADQGKKNRDMRMDIAKLQANSRAALQKQKTLNANDPLDKEIISAGKTLISANKALGDAQGKIGNKAWDTLGGGETREIATKRRARDEAEKNYNDLLAKKGAGQAIQGATGRTVVPKGTVADRGIVQQYLQKAGGDKDKARQMLTDDGYTIPSK